MPSQIAVVTGAGSGIGRATAQALGRAGFDIALLGRCPERLADAAQELARHSVRTLILEADVTDALGLSAAAARVEAELGPISVWVNCAGATVVGQVAALDAQDIHRATEVTYLGSVNGTLTALDVMRRRGEGTIVNLDLAEALRGLPLQAAESGARGALRGFCESLRSELLHDADTIHIAMVSLPSINTPRYAHTRNMTGKPLEPYGPVYEPEVAAEAICRAVFGRHRSISIGLGETLHALWRHVTPLWRESWLAKHAYKSQMGHDWLDTPQPDNLYAPAPGALAAHGPFETRSRRLESPLSLFVPSGLRAGLLGTLACALLLGLVRHHRRRG
ncbi:MAG: SDR family oxidoreductase [Acetobacter papayae]